MTTAFKDHFSGHAGSYARHRPDYPEALFDFLAGAAPSRALAWDCATGNGQAALALAQRFNRVIATDASEAQLRNAFPHPRVEYRVAPAERSGVEPDGSVDLVTVAQALHWFDIPAFYAEAARVLAPGAVLAAWAYGRFTVDEGVDEVMERLYTGIVGPYWPPERAMIDDEYREIVLPFAPVAAPEVAMERDWTMDDLRGYLDTWSSVQRYRAEKGADPVTLVEAELAEAWGPGERHVRWPLYLRVGRKQ